MAEAIARSRLPRSVEVRSAGVEAKPIHPLVFTVMEEIGVDMSQAQPKTLAALSANFMAGLNFVVALYAEGDGPTLSTSEAKMFYWPLSEPTLDQIEEFRHVRDEIARRVDGLLTLHVLPYQSAHAGEGLAKSL